MDLEDKQQDAKIIFLHSDLDSLFLSQEFLHNLDKQTRWLGLFSHSSIILSSSFMRAPRGGRLLERKEGILFPSDLEAEERGSLGVRRFF